MQWAWLPMRNLLLFLVNVVWQCIWLRVSMCPVWALTFERLDLDTSFWCAGTFQNVYFTFVYQAHWVRVKDDIEAKRDIQV